MFLLDGRSLGLVRSKLGLVVGVDGKQLLMDGLDGAIHLDDLTAGCGLNFPLNGLKGAALEGILTERRCLLLVRNACLEIRGFGDVFYRGDAEKKGGSEENVGKHCVCWLSVCAKMGELLLFGSD